MKFCLLIETTCSRVGLVRAESPHPALWLWSAAAWSQRDVPLPAFWVLLTVGPALAEVPGARLPNGVLQVPVQAEQLCCLLPRVSCCAALDLWHHGRPCNNPRIRLPHLAQSIGAEWLQHQQLEGHKHYFTAKLIPSS